MKEKEMKNIKLKIETVKDLINLMNNELNSKEENSSFNLESGQKMFKKLLPNYIVKDVNRSICDNGNFSRFINKRDNNLLSDRIFNNFNTSNADRLETFRDLYNNCERFYSKKLINIAGFIIDVFKSVLNFEFSNICYDNIYFDNKDEYIVCFSLLFLMVCIGKEKFKYLLEYISKDEKESIFFFYRLNQQFGDF